jgi:hypothetical protein
MSGCPDPGRLAAAASGEDPAVQAHAQACAACHARLAEQRAVITLADRWRPAPLTAVRRRALGDAILGAAEGVPAPARGRRWMIAAAAIAAAAAVTAIARQRAMPAGFAAQPSAALAPVGAPAPVSAPAPVMPPMPVPVPRVAVAAIGRARFTIARDHTVHLADGEIALVVPPGQALALATGDGNVTIHGGRALVRARGGVIAQVALFAGAAEIVAPAGHAAIVAGDVWTAPDRPAAARGVDAFRIGWLAFRAGRWRAAAAAFSRADDPVVIEDAAFWNAVAHLRAGDRLGARARFDAFVRAYPASSHRAAAVRAAAP